MKSFSPAAAFFAAWLPLGATAYDIGCIYPPNMPDPIEARFHLHRYSGSDLIAKKVETPVIVHAASFSDICQANCLAYHDENVLDILTRERPMAEVPKEYHNSWSRMMCITQCFEIVLDEAGQTGFFDEFWEKWGVTGIEKRRDEVSFLVSEAQAGRPQPLLDLLEEEDYHPYTVGQVVATELLFYVMEDGWNALGLKQYDTETGGIVDCTANCEHYKDTYGYFPRNIPTGRIENGTEKYVVEGNDKYWQPLVDQDGYGFFSAQKHGKDG